MITLKNLHKSYTTGRNSLHVLKGIDLNIEEGELVSIMGSSGSGKSTLLNVIGILDAYDQGEYKLNGQLITDLSEKKAARLRNSQLGFVFQSFHLVPMLTATENVLVPTMFVRGDHRERAHDLLERMGLGDRLDHRPDQLSGGQRQRVAIARALVNGPRLLLADEPTGNLDRDTGRNILNEFERISAEEEVGVVAVTHDELVTEFTDRTVELIDGVVQ